MGNNNKQELTPLQLLDQQYKQAEQDKLLKATEHRDSVRATIPSAFELNSERPVGLEVGSGTKYDEGMYATDLSDRAEYNAQNQTTGDKWKNATI